MFRPPAFILKLGGRQAESALEHRLSGADVALMFGVSPRTVRNWTARADEHFEHMTYFAPSGRPRYAYSLRGVRRWAERTGKPFDTSTLHSALRAEWKNLLAAGDD